MSAANAEGAMSGRGRAFFWCVVAYLVAFAAAIGAGYAVRTWHPIWVVIVADLVGTGVIFVFSVLFRNSSFYDAYWSVAPMAIVVYWALHPQVAGALGIQQLAAVALVWAWGARLTYNWARHWQGLQHEDWRYINIQKKTGVLYWPVSFLGIHLFPTIQVFFGCLALYPALVGGRQPFGFLDIAAIAITGAAVLIEALADQQLRAFSLSERKPEDILQTGLWAYSRHPNYLGEMLFWWGLWLFGMAAAPLVWWGVIGAVSITLMFFFISIPMIDKRMLQKRPHYAETMKQISGIIPWRSSHK